MYRAMIIDDEPWVIKTLEDSVNWSEYDFEIVHTESNSIQGFEMIRRLKPDLVFIDIRMPEMNGLECMKRARDLQLDTQFIVVSGFAEFSYAQKCLQLGAAGYCLKPIDEDEIIPLLKKVKEGLDVRRRKESISFMERMMEDTSESLQAIQDFATENGLSFSRAENLRVVCCLGSDESLSLKANRYKLIHKGLHKAIYLVQDNARTPIYEHFRVSTNPRWKGIGISGPIIKPDQVKPAVEEAELAAYHFFLSDSTSIYQVSEDRESGYSDFRELFPLLQRRDMTELNRLYDLFLERFTSGRYHIKHALFLYHTVMTIIIHSSSAESSLQHYLVYDYESLLERYRNIEEMIKDLKRTTIAYCGNMFDDGSRDIRHGSFKAIMQYMKEHSQQEITLQKLSETFYMNPNYISQLFIKHLSKSFTDYLAELRINHACRLLRSSHDPIQDIAFAVGIKDPYYFSKVFKKVTGQSPRAYRNAET